MTTSLMLSKTPYSCAPQSSLAPGPATARLSLHTSLSSPPQLTPHPPVPKKQPAHNRSPHSQLPLYEEFYAGGGTTRHDGDTLSNSIYAGKEGHGSQNGTPQHSIRYHGRSKDGRDI
ncbi:hypothetical protein JVT61DRAFT_3780 [Boletus reticuloceps]|uniref:Uncharacterized protein n=1 Tax=Boletus reticuloceps TaxID=495285 RepID=A0A8I3A9D4_9AGAM|nr:hypothetical protein JVT61DRAFT_3780 [Boletus reticuloceps]